MGGYLVRQYGEKDLSLWVGPDHSFQRLPVNFRQAQNVNHEM